jgi:2-phosphosulfolactate phosphatase
MPGMNQKVNKFYQQEGFSLRFDWGLLGMQGLLPVSDVIVVVDVLSFSSAVDVAVGRGAWVYPTPDRDIKAERLAQAVGGILAVRPLTPGSYGLSPSSLLDIPAGTRLVLPSPNGATLSAHTATTPTLAGCLRNARAVARLAQNLGNRITVIAAGERWPGGSLRPALEDLLGAGAILAELNGSYSPEAQAAVATFHGLQGRLPSILHECASGRELDQRSRSQDVDLAAALNASESAPLLQDGAFH